MSTLVESFGEIKKSWQWVVFGGGIFLVGVAVAAPNLMRMRPEATDAMVSKPLAQLYEARNREADTVLSNPRIESVNPAAAKANPDAVTARKIIRTCSIDMVVQRPAEAAEKITTIAEDLGGFVVSANSGGEQATTGMLTIRVPEARFDEARAEIRKIGLRVANEKIDTQDVSRQYVDQDASLRNLKAEEAQYLSILKQANTVKDMLAVTERLSEVRGQIEQQQAEFNALSRQIETVAITISFRTESEERVFGLNWRPLYQLRLALHEGLESLANYATAMLAIIVYLPAVLLWVGTFLAAIIGSWRAARWIGVRWFGWKITEPSVVVK